MTFLETYLGEIAALATAVCWTLNAMAFEAAGKRVGSLSVNYIRFFVAFPLLTVTAFFTRGSAFPTDATSLVHKWPRLIAYEILFKSIPLTALAGLIMETFHPAVVTRYRLVILSRSPRKQTEA